MNGSPQYEALKTQWFDATADCPLRPGPYEVRNSRPLHHNSKALLRGPRVRYWDGKEWYAIWVYSKIGDRHQLGLPLLPTVFGTHETHQWRGLTRRVGRLDIMNGDYFRFFVQGGLHNGQ